MSVAPQITQAFDDVAPATGSVFYGEYTNDTAPLVRVSLGDQAISGSLLQLSDNGLALGGALTLTAAQIAQGFADVPVSGLAEGWRLLTATLTESGGAVLATSMSFALGVSTTTPAAPVIASADDDAGPATGALADGARTDDTTPTFHIAEAGLPPPPTGSPGHPPYGGPPLLSGSIRLYEGDHLVGDAMIGFGGEVTITSGALAAGEHVLTAVAVDRAGNASPASAPFHLVVGPDAPQTTPGVSHRPTDGDDLLQAGPGFLQVFGGAGADTIQGGDAPDTLNGGPGSDRIVGGVGHNEVNGNQGEDTIIGRSTVGDVLLGGRGNDLIDATAATGHDSINGNLGADTIEGGAAGAHLWGGQGDDVIIGGAGADWISGDRGQNTVTGGGGADVFHGLASGFQRVTDFSLAQGDRVQIDAGVGFHISQSGADTVVALDGGGQVVLAGVQASSLSGNWIFQT